jgi:hypothetical protein
MGEVKRRTWRRRLLRAACRYRSFGLPVSLAVGTAHHVFMVVFCDEPGRKARDEVIWGWGVDNAMNGVVVTNGYKTQTLADV